MIFYAGDRQDAHTGSGWDLRPASRRLVEDGVRTGNAIQNFAIQARWSSPRLGSRNQNANLLDYPMIQFRIGRTDQVLVFSTEALKHMLSCRQSTRFRKEAGGQLFARISRYEIFIIEATGPRRSDVRTRFRYIPDRKAEQREINDRFQQGLIYVGDWHTHPSSAPVPSDRDRMSISQCFAKSTHQLDAFLLVIVGSVPSCETWFVGMCTSDGLRDVRQA